MNHEYINYTNMGYNVKPCMSNKIIYFNLPAQTIQ